MRRKGKIITACVVLPLAAASFLFAAGVLATDRSAERGVENSVTWRDHSYVPDSYGETYHEGKTTDGEHFRADTLGKALR